MNRLGKSLAISLFAFTLLTYSAFAQECDITKNDIDGLKQNFIDNTVQVKDKGSFFDLKGGVFHTESGKSFNSYIKDRHVSNVVFEDKIQFEHFLTYLDGISQKPCYFITGIDEKKKPLFFEDANKVYRIFAYKKNDNLLHITLYIQEGDKEDVDNYDERSYTYIFKKTNNGFFLSRINPAG